MEKDSAVQNTNYKLLDLMKFICAFLVIGIHTRPFQTVSDVADKLFYYNISIMRFHSFMLAQDIF